MTNLLQLLGEEDAEGIRKFLSTYSCPLNPDIEDFLKNRAIGFARQGIAQTHLVLGFSGDTTVLLAYFALASKVLRIPVDAYSKSLGKRLGRYGVLGSDNAYSVPIPLIAQLGKNFAGGLEKSISGDELLSIACAKVRMIQRDLGGCFVYIECEDIVPLTVFYADNGFRRISPVTLPEGQLVQMIKYQSVEIGAFSTHTPQGQHPISATPLVIPRMDR